MYKVGIIVSSDQGYEGKREDVSGPTIKRIVEAYGFEVHEICIVKDEVEMLKEVMNLYCELDLPLILTTGGTGFSKRDVTPEATLQVIERQAYGISEAIRQHSLQFTKRAMLSRGIAGIKGNSIIVNLPGSPKACQESLDYILPELHHGIQILRGESKECGRS